MAIANLSEIIQSGIIRKAQIQQEISQLQSQKTLAIYSQTEKTQLLTSERNQIRSYYSELYEDDKELQEEYLDYTQIPDFEEAIEKVTAIYQQQLDEIAAWETDIDNQMTALSAELEEITAYQEAYKSMLSSNIQEDFNFGLNG